MTVILGHGLYEVRFRCGFCGAENNLASQIEGEAPGPPEPGAWTVCAGCGYVYELVPGGGWQPVDPEWLNDDERARWRRVTRMVRGVAH